MFLFFHDLIFAHPTFSSSKTISHKHKRFPEWVHGQVVWILDGSTLIEFFPGWKKIKQRRVSFVLGCMILWKISTAISIKHRILATFSINKKLNSDSLYAFKGCISTNRQFTSAMENNFVGKHQCSLSYPGTCVW
jgi:hypothetical protein